MITRSITSRITRDIPSRLTETAVALAEVLSPEPWLQDEQGASCDASDMATCADSQGERGATLPVEAV